MGSLTNEAPKGANLRRTTIHSTVVAAACTTRKRHADMDAGLCGHAVPPQLSDAFYLVVQRFRGTQNQWRSHLLVLGVCVSNDDVLARDYGK